MFVYFSNVILLCRVFSIGLVFLNKYLLSSKDLKLDAPLFVTWYQCLVTVALCFGLSALSKSFPQFISFPQMSLDQKVSREVCKHFNILHLKTADTALVRGICGNDSF